MSFVHIETEEARQDEDEGFDERTAFDQAAEVLAHLEVDDSVIQTRVDRIFFVFVKAARAAVHLKSEDATHQGKEQNGEKAD